MIHAGNPKIAVVYCLHGDEILGERISNKLKVKYKDILFLEGNPGAKKTKKRFIKKDLNRVFPGNEQGYYEEKLAFGIKRNLANYDFVIDIHQTNTISDPFIIITKNSDGIQQLINSFSIKKIVFMDKNIANENALIDHVKCGISIEFSKNTSFSNAFEVINHV